MMIEDYNFSEMLQDELHRRELSDNYLEHSWNAFSQRQSNPYNFLGFSYGYRPDRTRLSIGNERSIIAGIYNRIGIDVAALKYIHAKVDKNGNFLERLDSSLNRCLNLEANLDQSGREFRLDAIISLMDEGCIAIVPTDADRDIEQHGAFEIESLRVGKIIEWYPKHVRISLYDENVGEKREIVLRKTSVAIIENPLYSVMNEHNSTLQRLIRKMNNLDVIDNQISSGKLDLILQFPYTTHSKRLQDRAEKRLENIERQAEFSKYGIIYADGTERITQLNRPVENNIFNEIQYLTSMLYSQLGITDEIMNGTADEPTMLNYYNRTVEPLAAALVDGMNRKFISKTAITQGKRIIFLNDSFKLVPMSQLAEIADRFTRNEILSSNEVRALIGKEPSDNPRADELVNKNIRQPEDENNNRSEDENEQETKKGEIQNGNRKV